MRPFAIGPLGVALTNPQHSATVRRQSVMCSDGVCPDSLILRRYTRSWKFSGKYPHMAHINQILKPVIKLLLEKGKRIVLLEGGDSGYSTDKNNSVCLWKGKHRFKSYFNRSNSRELLVATKNYVCKFPLE